ncbi:alpha/beta fold hydrolase [Nocardioides nitrophenolicus]|uniref:alpha/beta fold hydrolase n=1 Tax=Nocardioides nitrophenolicus TaxID=60489 RepID=UPI00195F12B5|nr:alpha/beta fold hydrolase [Nocardioides nitrophenolicus]MBM7519329.1 4,5:9,10-diseco-3-hydroxy-5,9,17-trioxoandrosta-1(10),2-diene-4-oate hydrolase [Nocardioides nitrophenolicus]
MTLHFHDTGDGPPVVLLHGAGPGVSGWSNFGGNVPALSRHLRTIVVDQPGFGASPSRDFTGDYFTHAAAEVVALLDDLGIEQAHLVGNSLGGGTAARLALDHPDRVDRLVLMGPGGLTSRLVIPEPTVGHLRLYAFFADPTRERLAEFMRGMVHDPSLVTDAMIDERFEQSQQPGVAESFARFRASFTDPANAERVELWRYAERITQPSLVLWGREDLVNPYDGALFAIARMPDVRLHLMSRCGHWAQVERATEFNRLVVGFLLDADGVEGAA